MVVRIDSYGVTIIGPFKDREAAKQYQERRVKLLREEEVKGISLRGGVAFLINTVNEPIESLMVEEAKAKTCGCCEHGK
jgi:hypothetical protein